MNIGTLATGSGIARGIGVNSEFGAEANATGSDPSPFSSAAA